MGETEPLYRPRRLALAAWALCALGGTAHGPALSRAAADWGLPLPMAAAGLAAAAAAVLAVLAASYLAWLPLSRRGRAARRGVARALALCGGLGLLLAVPLGLAPGLALGLLAGVALLWRAVGPSALLAPAAAALAAAAGFGLPALLYAALGPAWGAAAALPAALLAAAALALCAPPTARFAERLGPALVPALAAVLAGALWHGFAAPVRQYRAAGLSPRALVGVDGRGGCFARNRTGDVFHAAADGSWTRLPLPPGLRLGRVGEAGGEVLALEIRPEGDRLWRVRGETAVPEPVGAAGGETVFVADWAFDGGRPVAVDALGARLVWLGPGGAVVRSEYPPAEAGAPLLVAAEEGVHVYTESGAILRLTPAGGWSVLKVPPPPGRPAALAVAEGRYVLAVRAPGGRVALYALAGGVAGRWKALGVEGRWPRLASDGRAAFTLSGRAVRAAPLPGAAGAERELGPPAAAARRFERTPGGALIRLVE